MFTVSEVSIEVFEVVIVFIRLMRMLVLVSTDVIWIYSGNQTTSIFFAGRSLIMQRFCCTRTIRKLIDFIRL